MLASYDALAVATPSATALPLLCEVGALHVYALIIKLVSDAYQFSSLTVVVIES